MAKIINMQLMRYINLFGKICRISTTNCFVYNNTIFFGVDKRDVSQAIGKAGINIKKLSETFGRKVKIVSMIKINNEEEHPEEKLKEFIGSVVSPVGFSKIELSDNTHEMVITAGGKQNKAGLIGRNRTREQELKGILEEFFNIHRLRIA